VDLICVQRYLSIVTVVASGCGPMVSLRTGKRLGSAPHEQHLYRRVIVFWWQANRDLLSIFTFCNLFSVTTHL
jgi:hypothetical protein